MPLEESSTVRPKKNEILWAQWFDQGSAGGRGQVVEDVFHDSMLDF
jgi:hypothetical protein